MARSKHLDRWARQADYSDFDTYIRAGNSILEARRDIMRQIANLEGALHELRHLNEPQAADNAQPLADNAQIQGDEA
jgi:hypothetical protein